MKVKEIKFCFSVYGEDKTHTFAMGLGPCGRWVTTLTAEISLAALTITQESYAEDVHAAKIKCHQLHHQLVSEHAMAEGFHGYPTCGWDNFEHMTPPYEAWLKHSKENSLELNRLSSLLPETKVFVYRLEDIRGRITAIQ